MEIFYQNLTYLLQIVIVVRELITNSNLLFHFNKINSILEMNPIKFLALVIDFKILSQNFELAFTFAFVHLFIINLLIQSKFTFKII